MTLPGIAAIRKWRPAFVLSECGQIEPSRPLSQDVGA
jgi:hypothetical protein